MKIQSALAFLFGSIGLLSAATFTVTNTDDSGPGSLRQAMVDAENDADADIIAFNIPGAGPHTIDPLTQFPTNTHPVIIDGYTQPGASANTLSNGFNAVIKIRIMGTSNGSFQPTGFRLGSGTTLRGLAIFMQNQRTGIQFIAGGSSNTVAGCLIGMNIDGTVVGNGPSQRASTGLHIQNSSGNQIGGLTPADRNIISYNFSHGVFIDGSSASNNVVQGNFIGTSFNGTSINANFGSGVEVQDAPNNIIGGAESGARNVISGNGRGVRIKGFGSAQGNVIQGNLVGTDVTGLLALGNTADGVIIDAAQETMVGGSITGAGNVICGNTGFGVVINGATSTGNTVQGNSIGVNLNGAALGNGGGIAIGGNSNLIGGVLEREENRIAFNRGSGVSITSFFPGTGMQNRVRGNSIHSNTAQFGTILGIDLGNDGITANDVGDADTGANGNQNFPLLTSASGNGVTTTVQGTLNSIASQTYQLDFFGNTACDPSGNGEGQFYLGSVAVLTDGSGNGVFNTELPVASPGQFITATATDPFGNTSEFSPCFQATIAVPPMTFTVVNTNDSGPGSLRQAILDSNAHLSSQNNTVAFNIAGAGMQAIKLLSALPAFVRPVTIDGFTQPGASANTLTNGNNANWRIELRGVGLSFNEKILLLNLGGLEVRGLRIAGSGGKGIEMASSNCVVAGCYIYSNNAGGIYINASNGNQIGGTNPADRNVISGNNGSTGVEIFFSKGNSILGNFIGTDASGTAALGNQFKGVDLNTESSGNVIGGVAPGTGNWIAFHDTSGVSVQSGTNNPVRGNRFFSNAGLGIDLYFSGVTPNDLGDIDVGPNQIQNFPVLTNGTANLGSTVVQGTLNSRANTSYHLDFYSSAACNNSNSREGENYLGSGSVVTDANGDVAFSFNIPVTAIGGFLTATATDPDGNTSEFSPCFQPTIALPPATYVVVNTNDSGPGSLRQAIIEVGVAPNVGADSIHFNIPGTGPHRINLLTALPSPAQPIHLDGYTQPGASVNTSDTNNNAVLKIQLDGAQMPFDTALTLTNGHNIIRGISFTRVPSTALRVQSVSNIIEGNWIGIDPAGLPAGNPGGGVLVNQPFNRVGGTALAARNIIAANSFRGVTLNSSAASNNVVAGNFIGVGPNGIDSFGNTGEGILISGSRNLVGGSSAGAANVIGFNQMGVVISGGFSNRVEGNLIGTDASGATDLGNTGDGVRISGSSSNMIGGDLAGAGNLIAFNGEVGVAVLSGKQNGVFGNLIDFNDGVPVDVFATANDNITTPTLDAAFIGSTTVRGKHTGGKPNTTYRIDVTVTVRPPGAPRNAKSVSRPGSFTITTDSLGQATFEHTFPGSYPPFSEVRLQAHCENNSSELTPTQPLVNGGTADLEVGITAPANVTTPTNFTVTLFITNNGPETASNATATVNLPPGVSVISAESPNATCTVSNGEVSCELGGVPSGTVRRVDVVVSAPMPTVAVITGQATSQTPDWNPDNNSQTRETFASISPGAAADLEVSFVTVGDNMFTVAGQPTEIRVKVRNNGSGAAQQARLRVSVPPSGAANSEVTSVSTPIGTGVVDPGNSGVALFTFPILNPGQEFEVVVTCVWGNTPGTRENQGVYARITAQTPDPNGRNNLIGAALELLSVGIMNEISTGPGGHIYNSTWPTSAGQQLQSTLELQTPTVWIDVPANEIEVINSEYSHSFALSGAPEKQFFRLKAPLEELPSVQIYQQSIDLNGLFIPNSEWGRLQLRFNGTEAVQYVNFGFGGNWLIQNVPLLPHLGVGVPQETSFSFPIGAGGTEINQLNYSLSVTPTPLINLPGAMVFGPVWPDNVLLASGEQGKPLVYFPPDPLIGGAPVEVAHNQPVFPNHEQGRNECAPAGIANSLEYLNTRFSLGMDPQKISKEKIKSVIGWSPNGAPVGADPSKPLWAQRKAEYVDTNGLPVSTEITMNPATVMQALNNNCNVELRVTGHVACLRGMYPMGGTRYMLLISHDIKQGQAGGTVVEPIFFDSSNGKISGGVWTQRRTLTAFVLECAEP